MGYKYNVKDITANSIVEGREFDLAYGNYVQTINGDFDRENIRTDAVSANVCADNCFGEIFTLSDQNASETDIGFDGSVVGAGAVPSGLGANNPRGNGIPGYRWTDINNGGQWIEAASDTETFQNGMLSITWRCNIFQTKWQAINKFSLNSVSRVERRWHKWQIRIDGVPVAETSWITPQFWTTQLNAALPITQGSHTVSVHWWVPNGQNRDVTGTTTTMLMWWGGQLTTHNRTR